jgi:uncharacterized glyoxalase superfamily protein PhnB
MAASTAVLESVTPIFQVTDLARALAWYQQALGFEIGWTWGEPPSRASVCRDRTEVNLALPGNESMTISRAYFSVRGIDDYYRRIVDSGTELLVPIGDRPYGMRDFAVIDPSGNELSFGEATQP